MHFKFALNLMSEKIGHTFLSISMTVLGIIVIIFTIVQGIGTEYAYRQIDKLLTNGVEKTARLRIGELNPGFLAELAAQPEITAAGDFFSYEVYGLPELTEMQNLHRKKTKDSLNLPFISTEALNLCSLSLQEGTFDLDFPDEKTAYLYLGAGFKDIPIGTVYKTKNRSYIVAGILQKGQRFIDSDLAFGFDRHRSDYTFSCDYRVLAVVPPSLFTDGFWLVAADDYTLDQSLTKAFEIAKKYNVEIKYCTLRRSYEDAMFNVLAIKNIFSKLTPMVCVSCIIMILCMQLSDVFSGLRSFGIMQSQGFSQADVEWILIMKNMITFVVSLIASMPLVYLIVNFWYTNSNERTTVISKILLGHAIPAAVLATIGTIALSTLFSLIVFRKYSTVEMIGGHND